jgi:DnaK suppressor protein
MAATTLKKTMMKKEKHPAAKKKTVKSPSQKMSAKPPEKVKKTFTAKKKEKIITAAKKTAVKKVAAKKTVVKKTGTREKLQRKTGTSKDRFPDLRRSLLRKKETILKEVKEEIAKYISGENKQLVDTANDDGDWAQVDISEDLSLQRLSTHRKLMYNIDEAIRKIAEGTYGICEECGEEISEKRLLVLPTATLCVDCQENKEQFEALESEE